MLYLDIEKIKNTFIEGDALRILKQIPDESINSCITSPPYFNLRNYFNSDIIYGGNENCEHKWQENITKSNSWGEPNKNIEGIFKDKKENTSYFGETKNNQCIKCNAWKGQLGLEPDYKIYINNLILIFNEIKRVLKKDGTCFVNLADTFCGNKIGNTNKKWNKINSDSFKKEKALNIPEKSLIAIPARFQIAMIDQGWICRNDLIWIKRNGMPESAKDRWKKAHEHFYFFVKNKNYYFNLDAIRTQHKEISIKRAEYEQGRNALGQNSSSIGTKSEKYGMPRRFVKLNPKGAVPPDFLDINTNCKIGETVDHYATYPINLLNTLIKAGSREKDIILDPFMGSGTTAITSRFLSRNYLGIELNKDYVKIAKERLSQKNLFSEI